MGKVGVRVHKINHISLSVLLLSLILLISGCTSGGTGTGTGTNTDGAITGTSGLTARFLENMPPDKIYLSEGDSQEYPIMVELKNVGAKDLEPSDILFSLTGFDVNLINYADLGMSEKIYGKSVYNKEGGISVVDLGAITPDMPKIGRGYNPTFMLNIFYNYETKATIPICVDPRSYDPNVKNRACRVSDVTLSGGQGAPVAVVKVEEIASPTKVLFRIYFSNVGGGTLFSTYNLADVLSNGIQQRELDKIFIDSVTLGGEELTCIKSYSEIRVQDMLSCTYEGFSSKDAFSTVLNIKLKYSYATSIQKPVTIVSMGPENAN